MPIQYFLKVTDQKQMFFWYRSYPSALAEMPKSDRYQRKVLQLQRKYR